MATHSNKTLYFKPLWYSCCHCKAAIFGLHEIPLQAQITHLAVCDISISWSPYTKGNCALMLKTTFEGQMLLVIGEKPLTSYQIINFYLGCLCLWQTLQATTTIAYLCHATIIEHIKPWKAPKGGRAPEGSSLTLPCFSVLLLRVTFGIGEPRAINPSWREPVVPRIPTVQNWARFQPV